jgi:hypothetical protein
MSYKVHKLNSQAKLHEYSNGTFKYFHDVLCWKGSLMSPRHAEELLKDLYGNNYKYIK